MEAIKKQASKLREQVAKQQQAVLKQLGHISAEAYMVDEDELQCYRQLQNLYESTRATKQLQRNIVRCVEAFISISSKQKQIVRRLADNCCKYEAENQNSQSALARAAVQFGTSHNSMEDEREVLFEAFHDQVTEPLRTMINGAPLEDARHLTRRYDKLRQEVEAQAADVMRRQTKFKDSAISAESAMKLKILEDRLAELKSAMMALGREATGAMLSVEDQQQEMTLQCIFEMVDAERSYHRTIVSILEKLHAEMTQLSEPSSPASVTTQTDLDAHSEPGDSKFSDSDYQEESNHPDTFYIGKVIHSFDAQADGEINLSVGDYVIVRQVAPTGWSEGECDGKAGWFPSAYVERQRKAPASKVLERDAL